MNRLCILTVAAIALFGAECRAQRLAVGTDAVTWLNFGTMNAEASVAVARKVTVNAAAEINPWTFRTSRGQMQNRQQSYRLGIRWWPWHVYSGWWIGSGAKYREYNTGGITKPATEEGDALGIYASGGYSLMLTRHLNMEFGIGVFGGMKRYTEFACPKCGRITGEGQGWFILPDDITVALIWVF